MTIHGWGTPIYLSQVADEFGVVSTPRYMHQYYGGGETVPAGTVGYPSGGGAVVIPASGVLTLNNFYGASRIIGQYTVTSWDLGGGDYGYVKGLGGLFTPDAIPFTNPATTIYYMRYSSSTGITNWGVSVTVANGGWNNMSVNREGNISNFARVNATFGGNGWSWPADAQIPFWPNQISTVTFT